MPVTLFAEPHRASDRVAYALAKQWTAFSPRYALGLLAAKADRLLGVERSLLFTNVHVHSYGTIEDSVLLPDVEVARDCTIRRAVIDSHCKLPKGFTVGLDPEEDRKRFHVTEKGVTLITPEMLGQSIHHLH